jgi:hypothetical protein
MSVQTTQVTWRHSDSTPDASLALALDAKQYVTKPDGTPFSTAERVRVLRALSVASIIAIEQAKTGGSGLPPRLGEMETWTRIVARPLKPSDFPSREHATAAGVIAIGLQMFADPGVRPVYAAVTHNGDPAVLDERVSRMIGEGRRAANDTGFWPLVIAAVEVVVESAIWATAACYLGQVVGNVVDRKLGADTGTSRMTAALAAVTKMQDLHNQRETAAGGKPLPYTPEEKQICDAAIDAIHKVAAETRSPLPDPFMEATKKAGEAANKVAAAAEGAAGGLGLGLAAIGAVTAYVWMQK